MLKNGVSARNGAILTKIYTHILLGKGQELKILMSSKVL